MGNNNRSRFITLAIIIAMIAIFGKRGNITFRFVEILTSITMILSTLKIATTGTELISERMENIELISSILYGGIE